MKIRETIQALIERVKKEYERQTMYVLLDDSDESVAFSKRLAKRLRVDELGPTENMVMAFHRDDGHYGFALNDKKVAGKKTVTSVLQYDTKHKRWGFNCYCPSVSSMFWHWCVPAGTVVKMPVEVVEIEGQEYVLLEETVETVL